MRKYFNNAFIHDYVYCSGAKDAERIIRESLLAISSKLKSRAAKGDKRVFLPHPSEHTRPLRNCSKRYTHVRELLKDYIDTNKLPNNIHVHPVQANTLLFEDSIYNFTKKNLVELFNATNASGYAFLPMELLFKDMPANRMYLFVRDGDYARVTYRYGISNGYRHLFESWSLLLRSPVMCYRGTTLAVKIVSRMGQMCVFKIMRTASPEFRRVRDRLGFKYDEKFAGEAFEVAIGAGPGVGGSE